MRILIVDDDETMRVLLRETLFAMGFTDVVAAASGQEALRKIDKTNTPFDCFMLDIQMPKMDGIELCSIIRERPQYAKTPVLMITAMSQKSYIDRAFLAGANDYVTKPFDVLELQTRVQLAQQLQAEIKRAGAHAKKSKKSIGRPVIDTREFGDPVEIQDVNGCITISALQNYISKLAFFHHFSSGAFAIKVPQLRTAFHMLSERKFSDLLTEISEVLSNTLIGTQAFISYIGEGIFLCVSMKNQLPDMDKFTTDFLAALNGPGLADYEDMSGKFEALVGDVATPGFFSASGPSDFLIKAVDNLKQAERIAMERKPKVTPRRIVRQVA